MRYRRRRDKHQLKADINIVPFLDVLLVLLLIFMATAPIISQSVQVDLPESSDSQAVTNEDHTPTILEVSGVGNYSLSIAGERHEDLTSDQVVKLARAQFDQDNKGLFLVGGAKLVPYEEIIKALNLLHSAGIKSVGLMTEPLQ